MASIMDTTMPSMPGSYLFQHDYKHIDTGRTHNIFKPPAPSRTPSRRISQIPRPSSRSSSSNISRKRPKLDTNTSYFSRPTRPSNYKQSPTSTSLNLGGSYDQVSFNISDSTYSLDEQFPLSPSPLANSEYRLAEGLDTPSAALARGLEELEQDEAEKDYRFNRYSATNSSRATLSAENSARLSSSSQSQNYSVSSNVDRKRLRSPSSSLRNAGSLTGWKLRSTAWALTGGLAGRVFNFCISTAFRGFGAGSGQSYQMDISDFNNLQLTPSLEDYASKAGNRTPPFDACASDHDLGGFVQDYINSPESRKRRSDYTTRTDSCRWDGVDRSAIKNDWQIIDQTTFEDSDGAQSPVRKRSRASFAGGWQGSGLDKTITSTGASYASTRARPLPSTAVCNGSSQYSRAPSSGNHSFRPIHRSRPSFGSPRRSTSYLPITSTRTGQPQSSPERPSSSASIRNTTNSSASNLSPEVTQYKRKVRAQEKRQEEDFRRLNAQLQDMIREGKEALGSTVEIVDGDESGGCNLVAPDFDDGYDGDGWR